MTNTTKTFEALNNLKSAGMGFIGETVYLIPKYSGKAYCGIVTDKVQMIGITSRGIHIKAQEHHDHNKTYMLGKTAFFNKAEAKAVYNEMEKLKTEDETSETLSRGREILNRVLDYIKKARMKHPEVKDDMLYGDGAILLYCNANDGTDFDWEMNHSTCEFAVGYKTTKLGFIRAWVRRDGYITGYLYLDEGRDKAIKLNEEYIGEEDARYFASLLHLEADKKKIWDKPITEINFDREVRNDELLCPVW